LTKIERRIGKQPTYVAEQPLFGLVVFGPQMKTRVWIALDKSTRSQSEYDVAYVDLNANGDLTDKGERLTAKSASAGETRFMLPDFTDPATGDSHTEFSLRFAQRDNNAYQMIGVQWQGKQKFGGGYTANPDEETYSRFGSSPDSAPILWLNGDGPFTFQRWYTEPLRIGRETDLKLFIGVPGVGTSTFCAFQVHALPAGEGIEGILHYTSKDGEQRQSPFALMDKC
jgi:hypothetical protein